MTTFAVKHSPHQSDRKQPAKIRVLVLHADVSGSAASSINWLMQSESQASYHYIIERNGDITQLVPEHRKAWHAGSSEFFGVPNVNEFSIGVCFSNKQDGIELFDSRAIKAGVELCAAIMRKYGIGLECVVSHEQIARPMNRKSDPTPLFPQAAFITALRARLSRP